MDTLTRQVTLGLAYSVSERCKEVSTAQLFWAMDRFWFDRKDCDECSAEQRSEASMKCAVELDRRDAPMRNPTLPVDFPRDFPGQRPQQCF